MRILVVGAGAVGSYYSALLARRYPSETLLLAKRDGYDAIRKNGVVVKGEEGESSFPVQVTDDVSTLSRSDYVMLAVKMYDLEEALGQIERITRSATAVFGLENGISKEELIKRYTNSSPLLAATYLASEKLAPGVIRVLGAQCRVYIGEGGGLAQTHHHMEAEHDHHNHHNHEDGVGHDEETPRVIEIYNVLTESGIDCVLPEDIVLEMWCKFVYACSTQGVTAAARCTLGEAILGERTRRLMVESLGEGFRVAAAYGHDLPLQRKRLCLRGLEHDKKETRTAMMLDTVRERMTEIEFLNGELIRKAHAKGISVPANEEIYAALCSPIIPQATGVT